jgi:branched-subunit amino acid aminotransferase/4-amino-4-deoxychorismate lyase
MHASPLSGVKSLNRPFYQGLTRWARRKNCDEAFFLNTRGELVEGARTNIFLIKGSNVKTPALSCGCLPGVTRSVVIKILKKMGYSFRQAKIRSSELFSGDEIFVTNSLIGVMPVTRLDGKRVGSGFAGSLTRRVKKAYEKEVEKRCHLR